MPEQSYAGQGEHTPSYYAASANPAPARPALTGDQRFDICIVGAGYSGLSAGLHLAEKGHNVAIVEGAQVGWGASGRNGGQIVNGLNASLQTIARRYGHDMSRFVAGIAQEGQEIIRDRIATYDIKCGLKNGNVFTGYTSAHMRELEDRRALWASYGLTAQEMLSKEDLRAKVGSDVYAGGLIDHTGGHMHPLNLALGEAAAFEQNGGVIFERTPVTAVDDTGPAPVVKTAKGQITCNTLILCGNAYLGSVVPKLAVRVMPVSTQMIATAPLGDELAAQLIPSDHCFEDIRYILDYFRLSEDNRMIFGGGVGYGGTDPSDLTRKIRPAMLKVFPALRDIPIDYAWSGNFALSFSRVPQMGRIGQNIYFAHGYSGHGVTGSHLFGRILSEAVDADLSRFDVFAGVPWYPFPGGRLLRVPYSMMGAWYYALKDRLGL
ncbi:FAD-binding oxidoreductase [Yoonia sp. BS5-3]|uniref:FAD-binding oxidoreductase n=1 Tax=Yoonia phaeophyticola TaxID=3137369 RepID=A0ABZ2V0Y1_9RHOB